MNKCSVEGCSSVTARIIQGFCTRHYQQIKKYGCVLKRTNKDKNEFIFDGDVCLVTLYDQHDNERKEKAIIDTKDYEFIKDYRWCLFPGNYIWNNKTRMFLHNMLLGAKHIDHKNGNGLDNRRSNIRLANQSQNNMNKKIAKNNTSGFKGVHYDSFEKKWKVQIRKKRKLAFRALVDTKEEAALLYDQKAKELFGSFVRTNRMEGRI